MSLRSMVNLASFQTISEKRWFYPVALLFMGAISYGYIITSLGYYWDDWEIVMFNKLNPSLQFNFYIHDRPFPWTYQLIHFLVGNDPLGWHIVTLLIRWAAVVIFVRALILLWPRYENHLYWFGALILLYPGFLQQSQSATKARHIMTFLLFALSLYFMVLAVKRPRWARILFPLSWLATFLHLFTTEYFAGLELIRPLLLWLLLSRDQGNKLGALRRVLLTYLPYFAITVFYFWCRIIYFPQIFHTTSRLSEINSTVGGLQESLFGSSLILLDRALLDFIYLTTQVWVNAVIEFGNFTFQNRVAWLVFGVAIVLTALFALFYDTREKAVEPEDRTSPTTVFVVGLIAFILAAIPIWVIGKDISAGGWSDRFALAPLLGACLMVLALVLWLVRPGAQRLVLSFLLVFSIAAQMWVVNQYRRDWRTQLEYYWQLYWRAPALQPGTALFSFEQPSASVTHYADAGYAMNVLYHYETDDGSLPYWYFPRRFHFDYQPNDAVRYRLRNLEFVGNTSAGIGVIHQEQNYCLRVLDPVYKNDPILEGRDVLFAVSDPSRILADPNAPLPDPDIFGQEPAHDWCYFFQKADLARQTQDWEMVIKLFRQAKQNGFGPIIGSEYVPLIEAYAQSGDWQKAYETTKTAQKMTSGMKKMLCTTWQRYSKMPAVDANLLEQVKQSFACSEF